MVNALHKFHVADLVLFAITIIISISIGIYYALSGGRQRTTSEYLVGGRKMSFVPVAISLLVSFESSIMMLGVPAETYVFGIQWWIGVMGYFIANMLSIFIIVPMFHPLGLTSVYEYLEMRFKSKTVRLIGTVLGILTTLWYMGVVLFGPGIALEAVTGFPQWASITLIALAAAIYTSIGGLKAVIWTDVFQSLIMFSGCFAILIKGTIYAGGPVAVWNKAQEGGRLNFFVMDIDIYKRHTFWNLLFGSIIRGMGLSFNQSTCQRISATPTLKDAYKVLLITTPLHFIALSLAAYEGIIAYAYYATSRCDPLENGEITDPNQIVPYMVMDIFSQLPGMPGLFLASLFSASLSTLSTGLSSLSAIILKDIVKEIFGNLSEFRSTIVAKLTVVVSAIAAIGVALLIGQVGGTMTQIASTLISSFSGPLTGLFLLAVLCPWANSKGAITGTLVAVVLCTWLGLGSSFSSTRIKQPWLPPAPTDHCIADNSSMLNMNMTMMNFTIHMKEMESTSEPNLDMNIEPQGFDKMYSISYVLFGAIGVLSTLFIGVFVSFITGSMDIEDIDPHLVCPLFIKLFKCLPGSVRHTFRCDIDYTKKIKKKELFIRGVDITIQKPLKGEEMVLLNRNGEKVEH